MSINDSTDEQLASLAAQGNDEAMARLITAVMPIAVAKASGFDNMRLSGEDLVQEGMLGFLEAVKSFSPEKGVPFKAYASTCISNRIVSAVRSNLNSRNAALSHAAPMEGEEDGAGAVSSDPADILSDNEGVERIHGFLESELSAFEKEVIRRWLSDKSYSDIASELSCTEKSVDNALQRVRKKLRTVL